MAEKSEKEHEYLFDIHTPTPLNVGSITKATVSGLNPFQRRVVELLTKATVASTVACYAIAEIVKELKRTDTQVGDHDA